MKISDRESFEEALKKEKFSYKDKFGTLKGEKIKTELHRVVDLHNMSSKDAEERVMTELKSNFRKRTASIKFICGKGNHSVEGPVLRDSVKKILKSMNNLYLEYREDMNCNFYVTLRKL